MPIFCVSQETSKIEFKSIAINPLSIYLENDSGGFAISADVGLSYKENIFLVSTQFGYEFAVFTTYLDSFSELSLLWGREFKLTSWLRWDGFAGLGYFYLKEGNFDIRGHDRNSTVGFPLISKLKCMIGHHFSVGIQLRGNFNSLQTIGSAGLILQVDF